MRNHSLEGETEQITTFLYDELPSHIQPLAVKSMQQHYRECYDRVLTKAKANIKKNVHWCINYYYFLPSIFSMSKSYHQMLDQEYCLNAIREYHPEFEADGSLYELLPW